MVNRFGSPYMSPVASRSPYRASSEPLTALASVDAPSLHEPNEKAQERLLKILHNSYFAQQCFSDSENSGIFCELLRLNGINLMDDRDEPKVIQFFNHHQIYLKPGSYGRAFLEGRNRMGEFAKWYLSTRNFTGCIDTLTLAIDTIDDEQMLEAIFDAAVVQGLARTMNRWGETALTQACSNNNVSCARVLLSISGPHGGAIDIDAENEKGKTALMIAVEKGDPEMVLLLLDYGADPEGALPLVNRNLPNSDRIETALQKKKAEMEQQQEQEEASTSTDSVDARYPADGSDGESNYITLEDLEDMAQPWSVARNVAFRMRPITMANGNFI